MNEMQRERFYRSHEAPCVMVLKRILFTIFGNFTWENVIHFYTSSLFFVGSIMEWLMVNLRGNDHFPLCCPLKFKLMLDILLQRRNAKLFMNECGAQMISSLSFITNRLTKHYYDGLPRSRVKEEVRCGLRWKPNDVGSMTINCDGTRVKCKCNSISWRTHKR